MRNPINEESLLYDKDYFLKSRDIYNKHQGLVLSERLQSAFMIADVKHDDIVIDLGCGRGELLLQSALKRAKAIGFDFSASAINISKLTIKQLPEKLKTNVSLVMVDFNKGIRLPKASVIFMIDVLEHLRVDVAANLLKTAIAAILPHGRLIIHTKFGSRIVEKGAPELMSQELKYLSSKGHYAIYTLQFIQQAVPCKLDMKLYQSELLLVKKEQSSHE